jgi:hypothetical protein
LPDALITQSLAALLVLRRKLGLLPLNVPLPARPRPLRPSGCSSTSSLSSPAAAPLLLLAPALPVSTSFSRGAAAPATPISAALEESAATDTAPAACCCLPPASRATPPRSCPLPYPACRVLRLYCSKVRYSACTASCPLTSACLTSPMARSRMKSATEMP